MTEECAFGCDAATGRCHTAPEQSPCQSPPAPACQADPKRGSVACERVAYAAAGTCVEGGCDYAPTVEECPFSCDDETGACVAPETFCAGEVCGTESACGAVCERGSGCCVPVAYTRSTGPAPSGSAACCDEGHTMVAAFDCGDGRNHWHTSDGVRCAYGWEGSGNYGSACASVNCEGLDCE